MDYSLYYIYFLSRIIEPPKNPPANPPPLPPRKRFLITAVEKHSPS